MISLRMSAAERNALFAVLDLWVTSWPTASTRTAGQWVEGEFDQTAVHRAAGNAGLPFWIANPCGALGHHLFNVDIRARSRPRLAMKRRLVEAGWPPGPPISSGKFKVVEQADG